jgi:hypothetical protein
MTRGFVRQVFFSILFPAVSQAAGALAFISRSTSA